MSGAGGSTARLTRPRGEPITSTSTLRVEKAEPLRRDRRGGEPTTLAVAALGLVVLATPFLPTFATLTAGSAVAFLAVLQSPRGSRWGLSERALVAAFGFVVLVGVVFGGANERRFVDAATFVIVAPTFWVLGRRCSARQWEVIGRWFVLVVAVASIVAVAEVRTGSYLVQGASLLDASDRAGLLRARAFFPHPLVLALFCCIGLVIVRGGHVLRSRVVRWPCVVLLLAGVVSTGSRSGLAVAALVLVGGPVLERMRRWRFGRVWVLLFGLAAVAVVLGILGGYLRSTGTLVTSADADAASAQYRAELTRQLFSLLSQNVVGTGFGAVPPGVVLFESSFGVIDAARTVDSEFALAVIRFGVAGLVFWIVVLLTQVARLLDGITQADTIVLVVVLFAGVLALHVWPAVLPFMAFFLGLSSGARCRPAT